MEITNLGIITALKNVGVFLAASYTAQTIQENPIGFCYALILYLLISVPSDLYLINKAHEDGQTNQEETGET